ncbi:bifunctional diguanylate cyclase/phosphodiesterase [Micromonospora sp. HUAS LYJ1]|uniref:putative bifunctional diguanylate cyclase/phosphodiesterase n=1 Tax=Micromonospora sp. HUAS LYJ1 TaxID=3061626 RepID=UPI002672FB11|nr:GGDEF domain-containing protein [Micromonospora sp. HUAS LYJ1]WKU04540.1 GGDEF domain-containing protein [Micromonospora sp. HUAS LYJ1]
MTVAHPLRRPPSAPVVLAVLVALLVTAGLVDAVPPLAATTMAGAGGCAVAAARLFRLTADGGRDRRAHRRRRAAVLLNIAVTVVGMSVAVLPLAPASGRAGVAAAGLGAATLAYAVGLFLLPGHSRLTPRARWRRGVDVLGLGTALLFAGWVLVPPGPVPPVVRVVTVAGAGVLAGLLVGALAGHRRRPDTARCLLGAAAVLFGLAGLVVLLAYRTPTVTLLTAVPLLVGGALLTASGMARVVAGDPAGPTGPPPAWPRVTAPAAVATVAAAGHLAFVGGFTPTAVVLGLAVIPPLVARELISAADQRRWAGRLAAREAYFRTLVAGGRDLVLVLDDGLRVRWLSAAGERWFGLRREAVCGRALADLLHPDDAPGVLARLAGPPGDAVAPLLVARMRTGGGGWRETESTVSDQRTVPEVAAVVLHVRDVGDRHRLERERRRAAATDPLTGLSTRRELLRVLDERGGTPGALLLVDVHGLGPARDAADPDPLLVATARRLRDVVGPRDLVARLSGEEFAVVTDTGAVPAYALGERLLTALTEPCPVPTGMGRLRVGVGLTELAATSPQDAVRQADLARRRAVQLGRNRVEWYDVCLEEELVRRLDLERELPGAAARGELDLVYQPVLALADRRPAGIEALVRWRSPVLGTVLPAEFLPVAEDLGLLGELGRWVLDRACRQLADWSAGGRQLWLAVNVTLAELLAPDLVPRVAAVLAGYGVPAERLVLEIAEPRLGADLPTVVARLAGLRSLGVRTALDSFRAEHASLAQLRRLPIDLLKVQPRPVDPDEESCPLIDVVVGLGERLGVTVVMAELESEPDVARATRAGCRYGQGFALARPATAERVEAYFEEFPTTSR